MPGAISLKLLSLTSQAGIKGDASHPVTSVSLARLVEQTFNMGSSTLLIASAVSRSVPSTVEYNNDQTGNISADFCRLL